MATLVFNPVHNICMYSNIEDESIAEFHEAIQFLITSSIGFAVTANPTIFRAQIQTFWRHATVQGETIVSRVQNREIIITEQTVREALQFNDANVEDEMTTEEMHMTFRRMGFVGPFVKKMVKKNMLSYNWRLIAHVFLYSLSSRKGGFDEMSIPVATAMASLCTLRPFNFSSFIMDNMKRNISDPSKKFLMYPRFIQLLLNFTVPNLQPSAAILELKHMSSGTFRYLRRNSTGFSGLFTPLFPEMLAQINPQPEPIVLSSGDDTSEGHSYGVISATSPPHSHLSGASGDTEVDEGDELNITGNDAEAPHREGRSKATHDVIHRLPISVVYTRKIRRHTSPNPEQQDRVPSPPPVVDQAHSPPPTQVEVPHTSPTLSSEMMVPKSALDAAEVSNAALIIENIALKAQIKALEIVIKTLNSGVTSKSGGDRDEGDEGDRDEGNRNRGDEDENVEVVISAKNTGEIVQHKFKGGSSAGPTASSVTESTDEVPTEENLRLKLASDGQKIVIADWAQKIINSTVQRLGVSVVGGSSSDSEEETPVFKEKSTRKRRKSVGKKVQMAKKRKIVIEDSDEEEERETEMVDKEYERIGEIARIDMQYKHLAEALRYEGYFQLVENARLKFHENLKKGKKVVVEETDSDEGMMGKDDDKVASEEVVTEEKRDTAEEEVTSEDAELLLNAENYTKWMRNLLELNGINRRRSARMKLETMEEYVGLILKSKSKDDPDATFLRDLEAAMKASMETSSESAKVKEDLEKRDKSKVIQDDDEEEEDRSADLLRRKRKRVILEDVDEMEKERLLKEEEDRQLEEAKRLSLGAAGSSHVRIEMFDTDIFPHESVLRKRMMEYKKSFKKPQIVSWKYDFFNNQIVIMRDNHFPQIYKEVASIYKLPNADLAALSKLKLNQQGDFPHLNELEQNIKELVHSGFKDKAKFIAKAKRQTVKIDIPPSASKPITKGDESTRSKIVGWFYDAAAEECVIKRANGEEARFFDGMDLKSLSNQDILELEQYPFKHAEGNHEARFFITVFNSCLERAKSNTNPEKFAEEQIMKEALKTMN